MLSYINWFAYRRELTSWKQFCFNSLLPVWKKCVFCFLVVDLLFGSFVFVRFVDWIPTKQFMINLLYHFCWIHIFLFATRPLTLSVIFKGCISIWLQVLNLLWTLTSKFNKNTITYIQINLFEENHCSNLCWFLANTSKRSSPFSSSGSQLFDGKAKPSNDLFCL